MLDSKLASKLWSLHRDNLFALLRAKLGNKLAAKLLAQLSSFLASELGPNLVWFPNSIPVQNHRRNLPGGQSLVRTLYGEIVFPPAAGHYI